MSCMWRSSWTRSSRVRASAEATCGPPSAGGRAVVVAICLSPSSSPPGSPPGPESVTRASRDLPLGARHVRNGTSGLGGGALLFVRGHRAAVLGAPPPLAAPRRVALAAVLPDDG